ncbi:hypothetical protein [Hymenobacter terrestris]|uniref:DUF2798 domain-containing protein n=1 Tax=Hymenobacter terrestris TaxID=2748310 RepID=A0ABX2Q659_9BACT|nr:hypothetical protein [Hymenobacter terrestris]NVO86468.1 hypothetical protein [Hymenobacter terrestris]
MKWLPSFVRLFMLFILGLLLTFLGTMGFMNNLDGDSGIMYGFARIFGLVLLALAPLLILLKLFARMDRKSEQ